VGSDVATTLGDHRYDATLARDAAAIARAASERDALRARLEVIPRARLVAPTSSRTHSSRGGSRRARSRRLQVPRVDRRQRRGQPVRRAVVPGRVAHGEDPEDAANLVARMQQADTLIDATIANLSIGLRTGRVSSAEKLRRAIDQLDQELAKSVDSWAMMTPAWAITPTPDPWPEGQRDLQSARSASGHGKLVPAFVRLRDFLRESVLPKARTGKEGLAGCPTARRATPRRSRAMSGCR